MTTTTDMAGGAPPEAAGAGEGSDIIIPPAFEGAERFRLAEGRIQAVELRILAVEARQVEYDGEDRPKLRLIWTCAVGRSEQELAIWTSPYRTGAGKSRMDELLSAIGIAPDQPVQAGSLIGRELTATVRGRGDRASPEILGLAPICPEGPQPPLVCGGCLTQIQGQAIRAGDAAYCVACAQSQGML